MSWSNGFSWWSTLKARRAERRSREPDHGDVGTAFGLDASFGPVEDEAAASVPQQPPPSPPPWEHRVTRRSSL